MPSLATAWRRKQYLKEIKAGFEEGIEKFLRQELRKKHVSMHQIVETIKNLNPHLWNKFLLDFFKKVVKVELLGLDIAVIDRFYAKKLFNYALKYEDFNYLKIKEEVKKEIKDRLKNFAKEYYLKSEEEAIALFGEDYKIAKKLFKTDFLFQRGEGRKYYFADLNRKKVKEVKLSLKGVLETFREEIKGELKLSEKVLASKELKALKIWLLKELEKLKQSI